MQIASLSISVLALLFTILSFWWMNWRRGKLIVSPPRSYAALGSRDGDLDIDLPLVFFNTGPIPYIVENLRLIFADEEDPRPLSLNATSQNLGTRQNRAFATQFIVRGREAVSMVYEFKRRPGQMLFEPRRYDMKVQAKFAHKTAWQNICSFPLNVTELALPAINERLIVHDNMLDC
jgi:hypothetical protein